ncbi:ABC transporter permease subunit [Methylicorpusculum oleiharenae]|uniref:ABC transporter permease subunit n=1 Tax=Methylicorpusculum oleiharenae TaxID=1338687 RepID=UPI001356FAFE|nr:ABC transporter permease subunit [Methylicorpusculum oleiharenae]MCD2450255.1 ABC transporter permease subunit [Methylicorpusculum oleiharenae]
MTEKQISRPAFLASRIKACGGWYGLWRMTKDALLRYCVHAGGYGVMLMIALMFFYLVAMVMPLFIGASITQVGRYPVPDSSAGKTWLLGMDEQNKLGVRFTDKGRVIFFETETGRIIKTESIPLPENVTITGITHEAGYPSLVVYGLSDGKALLVQPHYALTFEHDRRTIIPSIDFPFGKKPIKLDESGKALFRLAVASEEGQASLAAITASGRLVLTRLAAKSSSPGASGFELLRKEYTLPIGSIEHLLLDKAGRTVYLVEASGILNWLKVDPAFEVLSQGRQDLVGPGRKLISVTLLNGHLSLLAGDDAGSVNQWAWMLGALGQPVLQQLRTFEVFGQAVMSIESEQRRKGFIALDAAGLAALFYSTSERKLLEVRLSENKIRAMALAPRATALLSESEDGSLSLWRLINNHPEVSLKSLWQKIRYESYAKPDYVWQSSSSGSDFEPKYSLTPLVYGTLKAAFYALLFAVPLALAGAVYTAYFMAPAMRKIVKPGIEIMEALPTVILGFLAGLWLAPFIEAHLFGIILTFWVTPISVLLAAYSWQYMPSSWRHTLPDGWEAAFLMPLIMLVVWFCLSFGGPMEAVFFDAGIKDWLSQQWGIEYDQRNAMVVGIAMGFAVIPGIFSIAEDAIFNVPRHLTIGSLALGATRWQTMMRVVLLTASPGIFSAVIVGFGRAVGETMIVLMATGNTPMMDFNIFQGMRTLSATIAIEMPESEAGATHSRLLFLAALLLFLFTFAVNTLSEWIRQRLRKNYSAL